MKNKLVLILTVVALVSAAAWRSQGQQNQTASTCFEYQVLADPTAWQGTDEGLKKLNQIGSQGWELAGVVQQGNAPPLLYFKRVKKLP